MRNLLPTDSFGRTVPDNFTRLLVFFRVRICRGEYSEHVKYERRCWWTWCFVLEKGKGAKNFGVGVFRSDRFRFRLSSPSSSAPPSHLSSLAAIPSLIIKSLIYYLSIIQVPWRRPARRLFYLVPAIEPSLESRSWSVAPHLRSQEAPNSRLPGFTKPGMI